MFSPRNDAPPPPAVTAICSVLPRSNLGWNPRVFLSMPAHPPPEQSRIGQQPICAIIPPNHSTTVVTFVFLLCLAALRCRKYLPTSVLSCAGSDFFILTRTSSSALPCPPLPCSVLCCPVLSCLVLSCSNFLLISFTVRACCSGRCFGRT